ncbi:hypothetical protein BpHYR1_007082 [Brachionus plicatilis]|uniref:Uncharacterized protein n=1 Tax=Brachionus plicatilis TaxID=10195 RepID=A0A3M7PL96_BRAPC|nr:hypothetical protein BpHYR1_007082 [Brachionus plicatilis]
MRILKIVVVVIMLWGLNYIPESLNQDSAPDPYIKEQVQINLNLEKVQKEQKYVILKHISKSCLEQCGTVA